VPSLFLLRQEWRPALSVTTAPYIRSAFPATRTLLGRHWETRMKTCFEYHHHQDHFACVILVDIRTAGGFKLPHPDSAASIRVSQLLYTTSERSKRDPTDRIVIVSFITCSDSDLVLDVIAFHSTSILQAGTYERRCWGIC